MPTQGDNTVEKKDGYTVGKFVKDIFSVPAAVIITGISTLARIVTAGLAFGGASLTNGFFKVFGGLAIGAAEGVNLLRKGLGYMAV
tara:strand:+ start:590 stop:847 length:258 start_codon:yes stop_codon:yes gene_type:complete